MSGLNRFPAKKVLVKNGPWVRIPHSPPYSVLNSVEQSATLRTWKPGVRFSQDRPMLNNQGDHMPNIDVDEVARYVKDLGAGTKIYLGADSERYKINRVWWAEYTTVAVIHRNGNNGCKIFGEMDRERDYDQRYNRPSMRLMNEVYRVSELFQRLAPVLAEWPIEVHLDINPDEMHGSSCVVQQAIGYIRGTCNVIPMVKPRAFAASYAADRLKSVRAA
jgi:uncharacterized protein